MIARHPCVRVFLNGILHASHGFSFGNLCSGSWTMRLSFTVWSSREPNTPIGVFHRFRSLSWGAEE